MYRYNKNTHPRGRRKHWGFVSQKQYDDETIDSDESEIDSFEDIDKLSDFLEEDDSYSDKDLGDDWNYDESPRKQQKMSLYLNDIYEEVTSQYKGRRGSRGGGYYQLNRQSRTSHRTFQYQQNYRRTGGDFENRQKRYGEKESKELNYQSSSNRRTTSSKEREASSSKRSEREKHTSTKKQERDRKSSPSRKDREKRKSSSKTDDKETKDEGSGSRRKQMKHDDAVTEEKHSKRDTRRSSQKDKEEDEHESSKTQKEKQNNDMAKSEIESSVKENEVQQKQTAQPVIEEKEVRKSKLENRKEEEKQERMKETCSDSSKTERKERRKENQTEAKSKLKQRESCAIKESATAAKDSKRQKKSESKLSQEVGECSGKLKQSKQRENVEKVSKECSDLEEVSDCTNKSCTYEDVSDDNASSVGTQKTERYDNRKLERRSRVRSNSKERKVINSERKRDKERSNSKERKVVSEREKDKEISTSNRRSKREKERESRKESNKRSRTERHNSTSSDRKHQASLKEESPVSLSDDQTSMRDQRCKSPLHDRQHISPSDRRHASTSSARRYRSSTVDRRYGSSSSDRNKREESPKTGKEHAFRPSRRYASPVSDRSVSPRATYPLQERHVSPSADGSAAQRRRERYLSSETESIGKKRDRTRSPCEYSQPSKRERNISYERRGYESPKRSGEQARSEWGSFTSRDRLYSASNERRSRSPSYESYSSRKATTHHKSAEYQRQASPEYSHERRERWSSNKLRDRRESPVPYNRSTSPTTYRRIRRSDSLSPRRSDIAMWGALSSQESSRERGRIIYKHERSDETPKHQESNATKDTVDSHSKEIFHWYCPQDLPERFQLDDQEVEKVLRKPEFTRILFVDNLSLETTRKNFQRFLQHWVDVKDVALFLDTKETYSKAHGFVIFSHSLMVDVMLSMGNLKVDGNDLLLRRALPKQSGTQQEPENLRKMFIGNIDRKISEEAISKYFSCWGEVEDTVILNSSDGARSQNFGVVVFGRAYMVDDCFTSSPHVIEGCEVNVWRENASQTESQQETHDEDEARDGTKDITMRKLFVGGLLPVTDETKLTIYFERWGEVVDCLIVRDYYTRRSKGFAFITYKFAYQAYDALKCQKHAIDGKEISVKKFETRTPGSQPVEDPEPPIQSNKYTCAVISRKLFVTGLEVHITEDDLRNYFENWGRVCSVQIMRDMLTNQSKGRASIEYAESYMVDHALAAWPHRIKGCGITLMEFTIKQKESREDELLRKLFISGLNPTTTQASVKRYFEKWGTVEYVSLEVQSDTVRCHYFGFVVFTHSKMANAAVSIQHHVLDGKVIMVKLARDNIQPVAPALLSDEVEGEFSSDSEPAATPEPESEHEDSFEMLPEYIPEEENDQKSEKRKHSEKVKKSRSKGSKIKSHDKQHKKKKKKETSKKKHRRKSSKKDEEVKMEKTESDEIIDSSNEELQPAVATAQEDNQTMEDHDLVSLEDVEVPTKCKAEDTKASDFHTKFYDPQQQANAFAEQRKEEIKEMPEDANSSDFHTKLYDLQQQASAFAEQRKKELKRMEEMLISKQQLQLLAQQSEIVRLQQQQAEIARQKYALQQIIRQQREQYAQMQQEAFFYTEMQREWNEKPNALIPVGEVPTHQWSYGNEHARPNVYVKTHPSVPPPGGNPIAVGQHLRQIQHVRQTPPHHVPSTIQRDPRLQRRYGSLHNHQPRLLPADASTSRHHAVKPLEAASNIPRDQVSRNLPTHDERIPQPSTSGKPDNCQMQQKEKEEHCAELPKTVTESSSVLPKDNAVESLQEYSMEKCRESEASSKDIEDEIVALLAVTKDIISLDTEQDQDYSYLSGKFAPFSFHKDHKITKKSISKVDDKVVGKFFDISRKAICDAKSKVEINTESPADSEHSLEDQTETAAKETTAARTPYTEPLEDSKYTLDASVAGGSSENSTHAESAEDPKELCAQSLDMVSVEDSVEHGSELAKDSLETNIMAQGAQNSKEPCFDSLATASVENSTPMELTDHSQDKCVQLLATNSVEHSKVQCTEPAKESEELCKEIGENLNQEHAEDSKEFSVDSVAADSVENSTPMELTDHSQDKCVQLLATNSVEHSKVQCTEPAKESEELCKEIGENLNQEHAEDSKEFSVDSVAADSVENSTPMELTDHSQDKCVQLLATNPVEHSKVQCTEPTKESEKLCKGIGENLNQERAEYSKELSVDSLAADSVENSTHMELTDHSQDVCVQLLATNLADNSNVQCTEHMKASEKSCEKRGESSSNECFPAMESENNVNVTRVDESQIISANPDNVQKELPTSSKEVSDKSTTKDLCCPNCSAPRAEKSKLVKNRKRSVMTQVEMIEDNIAGYCIVMKGQARTSKSTKPRSFHMSSTSVRSFPESMFHIL